MRRPRAARELLDEERAAARLARDRLGDALGARVSRDPRSASARRRASSGSSGPTGCSRTSAPAGQRALDLEQERARVRLLVPVRHHEQERRRVGRPHQLEEQRRAVDVAPLHVVDEDDERLAPRELREELAQRDERALAQHVRIGDRPPPTRGRCPGTRREHGEEARERPDVPRHDDRLALIGEPLQVAAERVDDAVDRLVGHRLALVGAAAQDLGLAVLASSSRKWWTSVDLPMPDAPGTRTVTECPRRVASNASRRRAQVLLAADEREAHVGRAARGARAGRSRRPRGGAGSRGPSAARARRGGGARSRARRAPAARRRRTRSAAIGSSVRFIASTSTAVPANGGRPTSAS